MSKEVKKLLKHHLKICNSVLIYKICKKRDEIVKVIEVVESIFRGVNEEDFPLEVIDF